MAANNHISLPWGVYSDKAEIQSLLEGLNSKVFIQNVSYAFL